MSVGDQGKEFPIQEKTVFGVNLVNPSLGQVGSTDVKTHREALDTHGSDLQSLSFGSHHEGEGVPEPTLDVEVGALSCSPYSRKVVGFEMVLSQG